MILSAELSPVQGGVGGGDVLGEEGDGQGQVSEGGETLSQSSEEAAQSSQSEVSSLEKPHNQLTNLPGSLSLQTN